MPGLYPPFAQRLFSDHDEVGRVAQGDLCDRVGFDDLQHLSANVDGDSVIISLNALTEHAMDAVALVADLSQNANFPDNEVALIKSNMEDELRSNEARPRFLTRRAWYQVTYRNHPYHTFYLPA